VRLANASELADEYHNVHDWSKMPASTRLTLMDIAFLANSDFLVGTFSSQISRLAFELMTSRHGLVGHVYRKKPEKVVLFSSS
jgi:gamma-glutamylcysteine synthetase